MTKTLDNTENYVKESYIRGTILALCDLELDCLVACLLTKPPKAMTTRGGQVKIFISLPKNEEGTSVYKPYSPTTYWTHGGPIIQQFMISLINWSVDPINSKPEDQCWGAYIGHDYQLENSLCMTSDTQLSAAIKCFCMIKMMNISSQKINKLISLVRGTIKDASRK